MEEHMRFTVNHHIDITLLDEDECDEVMTVSMRVRKLTDNAAEFVCTGESDRSKKYIAVAGKNICYIDSDSDFGTFISEVYSLDDIESGLENNSDYGEEECKVYAKAIELICTDILNLPVISNDKPFPDFQY